MEGHGVNSLKLMMQKILIGWRIVKPEFIFSYADIFQIFLLQMKCIQMGLIIQICY